MRIIICRLCAAEYPMHLANALADAHDVVLFLSKSNLAIRYPGIDDVGSWLKENQLLKPSIALRLVDYPRGSYLRKPFWAAGFVRELRKLSPDIVHYHSDGNPWIPLALPTLRGIPLVVSIHDATPHSGDFPPPALLRMVNRLATRRADQIIVHGEQQADVVRSELSIPNSKLNVVPLGGYTIFRQLTKGEVPEEPHLVLFFGRIRAYKGLAHLIEAADLVAEKVPDVKFLIAGSGDHLEEYAALTEHSERFIVRQGFVPMDAVGELFQRAAVVALPYIDASQSGVVPLAYVFGKPVVTTRVGSIPEVVDDGQTGYLIEPRDSAQLAEALIKLLTDPVLRHQMGQNALRKVHTELSWERIAEKTLQVYARAMERRR
jgi:glycosyltransferase involved in cell wall biosynthesis